MSFDYAFLVALVQGLTEFLPISSSGHLILLEHLSGAARHGLIIDVAAHFGTLCAAMIYFRKDVSICLYGAASFAAPVFAAKRGGTAAARHLVMLVVLASLPTAILGFVLFATGWIDILRDVKIIAAANLVFALLLFAADRRAELKTDLAQMDWRASLWVGIAQMAALIPGASRAGCCITAARACGFSRFQAARFALFLSILPILGAVALGLRSIETWVHFQEAALTAFLSFGISFLVLSAFIRMMPRFSLTPFVIYRLIFAFILFML